MSEFITNSTFHGDFEEQQLQDLLGESPEQCSFSFCETGVYDFHGARVNEISISNDNVTVKNVTVDKVVDVNGSYCTFENVRFEGTTQSVLFTNNTHNTLFDRCTFIGDNDTEYAMNADANVNTDVVISNCYFTGFDKIIYVPFSKTSAEPVKLNATFTGGWCDGISYVVHSSSNIKANLFFNSFNINNVINVFKCDRGVWTHSNVIINSMLGNIIPTEEENPLWGGSSVSIEGIVYFTNGVVNLECNVPISSSTKFFCDEAPDTRYCNVQNGGSDYPFGIKTHTRNIDFTLAPNEVFSLGSLYFTNIELDENSSLSSQDITVFVDDSPYILGTKVNGVKYVKIQNNKSENGESKSITGTLNINTEMYLVSCN